MREHEPGARDIGLAAFERWRTDYALKTLTAAVGSLVVTFAFALYNGFLGIRHASLWYGTICVYYIVLVLLRGMILLAEYRLAGERKTGRRRARAYLVASVGLLVLNLSLIIPVSLLVLQQKPVNLSMIPAIAMAAYTTYKVIMASIHLKRRKQVKDSLIRLLRTINFIDALVSILTLQNTLIMVNASGETSKCCRSQRQARFSFCLQYSRFQFLR